MVMNTKKLIMVAKKWQQRAALSTTSRSTTVEKGCFVVYTADKARFAFPISYLSNSVFQELLKISEEEFGIPASGPITLPFDSAFLKYLITLIERRMDVDTEKALITSISIASCSLQCSLQQQSSTQRFLVL